MAEPGEEGYRTPTGEDIEQTKRLHSEASTLRQRGSRSTAMSARSLEDEPGQPAMGSNDEKPEGGGGLPHSPPPDQHSEDATPQDHSIDDEPVLSWRQRLRHFTWTFFTITMATGGIASVLYHVPFRFRGLYTLGCIFFLLNLVLFSINITCISLRFYFHPHTFRNSILHPTESLFLPAATVSFGTILMNISQYAYGRVGDWLNSVVMILFWLDVGLAVIASFGVYLLMWSTQTFTIATMTPIWIFPAYPLLIIGPHAGVLSSDLSPERSARVLVGGFTAQGIGIMVSLMIYSAYIYRLMTQKLPRESLRPGMFVSVGPSAFTASALINMSKNASRAYGNTDFMGNGELAALVMQVIASWAALWFWGLACWFFCISVGAHYTFFFRGARMPFAMTWFSYVFPQTALVNATFAVAKAFDIYPLQILGCAMTILLCCMWLFVVYMMGRAVWLRQILWPQKGEDKDEGGFKGTSAGPELEDITVTNPATMGVDRGKRSV
jgi:C4-dicarboxylate transporter/malic acid transport protein